MTYIKRKEIMTTKSDLSQLKEVTKEWDSIHYEVLLPFDLVASPGFSNAKFEIPSLRKRRRDKITKIWNKKTQN
jgi:hypothetical protein